MAFVREAMPDRSEPKSLNRLEELRLAKAEDDDGIPDLDISDEDRFMRHFMTPHMSSAVIDGPLVADPSQAVSGAISPGQAGCSSISGRKSRPQ
jgi:hypothetical protein